MRRAAVCTVIWQDAVASEPTGPSFAVPEPF